MDWMFKKIYHVCPRSTLCPLEKNLLLLKTTQELYLGDHCGHFGRSQRLERLAVAPEVHPSAANAYLFLNAFLQATQKTKQTKPKESPPITMHMSAQRHICARRSASFLLTDASLLRPTVMTAHFCSIWLNGSKPSR